MSRLLVYSLLPQAKLAMSQTVEMCAGAKWQQVEHDPIDGKCISQNQISVFILEKALWRL